MDEIRRRLAEIDKQLAHRPASYHKQIVTTAPLLFCAVGMMTGIIIQDYLPAPVRFWLVILGVCAAAMVMVVARRFRQVYAVAYLALACFACAGAIRLASFNQPGRSDISKLVGDKAILATIRGVIVTKPYLDSNKWAFSKFSHTDRGSSFYLKMTEAEMVNGWAKTGGLVRVRVDEPVMDLKTGDCVQIYCRLDRFKNATNPGEFDIAKYMSRSGVFVAASVESRDAIELLQSNAAGAYAKIKGTLQKIATQALIGRGETQSDEENLLLALVLGYRTDIDKTILEAFRQTGLLHFVCLSGMNFAMVIGFVWWVCKTAGLMKQGRAIVCIVAAVLFLLVVPENAPAFRAAIMCFAFCGSFIFRRKSNPFNSLALAAVVLLLIRPTGLFEAGWQLSFVSVLGILLFAKPISSFLREKAADLFDADRQKDSAIFRIVAKIGSVVADAFSVSLAAWLSIAGIMLYHFYTIQWLTIIWTVLVSPLIGLVSFLGYLKLIIALASPSIASLIGWMVNILSGWLILIVKLIAGLNISQILVGKTSNWTIVLYYALIVFVVFFRLQQRFIRKAICTTTIVLLAGMVAMPWWQRTYRDCLTLTVLDVGHGQAILAELPGGVSILFDAGSLSRSDIGTRIVSPFLQYRGRGKIDAVIISHGDIDHINGLPEIVDVCQTNVAVYASNVFFDDSRPTVDFLKKYLGQKSVRIPPDGNIPVSGDATVKALWPDKDVLENNGISDNNKSIVTMIEYAGRRILISSDIEKFAQNEILRLYPDLKADVLIAPHHGSVKTLERDFINRLQPGTIICSCDRTSYEEERVIRQSAGSGLYHTGTDGAVTVRVNKQGTIETKTFAK
ncbi:MAG: DNA internalization-related competence protein ComEC/Rec2 [Sedimentisphaerales bacterium]